MRQKSPENGLWTKTLQSPENAGCRLQTLAPHLFINPQVDWKNSGGQWQSRLYGLKKMGQHERLMDEAGKPLFSSAADRF
jgi:hypothetical protein